MTNEQSGSLGHAAVRILVAIFIFVASLFILLLAAECRFNAAEKLAAAYLWEKADAKFKEAVALDPFDARHLAGYADFLRAVAPYRDEEISLLMKAEKLYRRAYKLDPMNAEYPLRIGEIEVKLFLKDKKAHRNGLKTGLDYFKKALEDDPNGFNISYEIGNRGIEAWSYLDEESKELVCQRLRYVLSQKRWFWEYIYPWVWQQAQDFQVLERIAPQNEVAYRDLLYFLESNNLYQFRKRVAENVNFYMKKEEPEKFFAKERERFERVDALKKSLLLNSFPRGVIAAGEWRGKTADGINEFKDGQMYWTGSMSALLAVPEGQAILLIQARGAAADDIYPYMIVELDQEVIGETFVNNDEWKEFAFAVKAQASTKVLTITYCNDGANVKKNEDRDLFIGEAKIVSDER